MSATSAMTPAKTVAMVMRYVSRLRMCGDLVRDDRFELALRHRAEEPRRHADVAGRRPEARGERVRRVVVDDAQLRRDRQPCSDGDVLDDAAQRAQLVLAERLRARDPRDHAPRAEDPEHARRRAPRRARRRRARCRRRSRRSRRVSGGEARSRRRRCSSAGGFGGSAAAASRRRRERDLRHAVSPAAEKNSRSRKPSGRATSTHGMLWIAVL